ncbi:MFS transporter [Dictyobacter arantiisoli]|uniref:Nitrate transporter n=1 Tax=Dictyobacter arantiisoli TaxID=2014874 RepID=A0A5A5TH22_9CHLR|nr:MFS transporter [Dictyobacter arantiisoli]GCF10612.1 nitrate transporter [Dictyobacter arantiisoli]
MPLMTMRKEETPAGAKSTVLASFLHFDMCFTIWVLLGSLSIPITQSMGLNPFLQTLMVATPTLSGSLMRIPMGFLGDRFGGRRVGILMLVFLFIPLTLGWLVNINFPTLLCVGLMLGVGGSSFSVALPLASRWYPPSKQGIVMGISAAGNIGVVFANLLAPTLAKAYGWHLVFGITMIPLAVILLAFTLLAKNNPDFIRAPEQTRYATVLAKGDLWWLCLLYCITFGGFVGLGTFLPQFFHNQYKLTAINAGYITALATFMGSTFRPLGGYLSDKFGGVRALTCVLLLVVITYAIAAFLLPLAYMAPLLVLGVLFLGMGNGCVFQLVPQRFRLEIGIVTGIVGAFGGVGGFVLPLILGSFKQTSGSYATGWLVLAGLALLALIMLRLLVVTQHSWRTTRATTVAPAPEYQV